MKTFQDLFQESPLTAVLGFLGLLMFYAVVCLPLLLGILWVFYYLLTLPMRRNERARLFLDLLETGLANGKTAEAVVIEAADTTDKSLGGPLLRLGMRLRSGMSFADALDQSTRLLTPQLRAMLKAGLQIGDLRKVLPACRQLLRDGISQVRSALNYLVLLFFCVTPFMIAVPVMLGVFVLPKYKEVFAGMSNGPLPAFTQTVFSNYPVFIAVQITFLATGWLVTITYLGGPRLRGLLKMLTHAVAPPARGWLEIPLMQFPDSLIYRLPWKRKRLHRDFSTMLSLLLDAGLREPEAVSLAAESTANRSVIRRGRKVCAELASGMRLTEALRVMDDAGELQWRLRNALHGPGGFIRALTGWHETLDAKAFQQEQAAAHVATSALVLFNGVAVAVFVIAIFIALIELLNEVALW